MTSDITAKLEMENVSTLNHETRKQPSDEDRRVRKRIAEAKEEHANAELKRTREIIYRNTALVHKLL
jgi:uncharacterized protein YfkK (UPF0435 family)